ncbi:MAG: hypothetical protein LBU95_04385, partial [Rikenellaceae bacterium]|nr:hypothetical protein [Rikenellaceae bacterium]
MKRALTIFIFACIALAAAGQTARVAGLEKNARYMELLAMEQTLRNQEDSISGLLTKARVDLRTLVDQRARLGAEILRLENQVFDVRNQMGIVAGQINTIEQQYIISNMGSVPLAAFPGQTAAPAGAPTASGQTLPAYVAKNLDAADLTVWKKAGAMEKQVSTLVGKYMDNYAIAKRLADDYAVETSAARADSIYNRLNSYSRTNQAISDSVGKLWVYVFDNKSYLCNLLMDKANNRDYLASAEERAQALQARQAQLRGTFTSDVVGLYPIEKRYVLECELAMAQFIGDKK